MKKVLFMYCFVLFFSMLIGQELTRQEIADIEREFEEKFKKEFNFEGEVEYSYKAKRLFYLEGHFVNFIPPKKGNKEDIIQISEQIYNLLGDYIVIDIKDLVITNIVCGDVLSRITYQHKINGYHVKDNKFIVSYLYGLNKLRVANHLVTVDIESTVPKLTQADVLEMYWENTPERKPPLDKSKRTFEDNLNAFYPPGWYIDIRRVKVNGKKQFRLCYTGGGKYAFDVDAITGEIYNNYLAPVYD